MNAPTAAQVLGRFAADLRFEDIPADVVAQARRCIIDTVAVAIHGSRFAWSANFAGYARRYGTGGPCTALGLPGVKLHAPYAALLNGAFAHAFEQDSLRFPGAGVHPGATLLPPALALAEETRGDGKALLTAFVAGCEVMFRIGAASRHSSEALGFHAPGLTGPYGAAISAGRMLGLDAQALAHALGIAGSLSAGLLAFTQANDGAAVKKMHLGRAAEAGVLAARLAQSGMAGPENVLEGRFGFLSAYCRAADESKLTEGLGTDWETRNICLKAYACHVTAHTPVQALREAMARHSFAGRDVADIVVEGAGKLVSHHNIVAPSDVMQAQYSIPFCVALALFRDPTDPDSFGEATLHDPDIRAMCRRIRLQEFADGTMPKSSWHTRLTVHLADGTALTLDSPEFHGMPSDPPSPEAVRAKFLSLGRALGQEQAQALFEKLEHIEELPEIALG